MEEARKRRAVEREARRRRRRERREKGVAGGKDHHDGLSSDDELLESNRLKFVNEISTLPQPTCMMKMSELYMYIARRSCQFFTTYCT